ncbi:MAG TPA: hypothetical protein VJT67_12535 [Longimicrobiaceae bacterium]|nr:hypothetical protein [Longimicrobiaceae bacterium]
MVVEEAGKSTPPSGGTVALWLGLAGGPVVVLFNQWVAYSLVPDACARQNSLFVHVVHLVALLLLAAGYLVCHRAWSRLGAVEPDERPGPEHRARFMAFSGMLTNPFLALVVLAMWLATFLFSPCSA